MRICIPIWRRYAGSAQRITITKSRAALQPKVLVKKIPVCRRQLLAANKKIIRIAIDSICLRCDGVFDGTRQHDADHESDIDAAVNAARAFVAFPPRFGNPDRAALCESMVTNHRTQFSQPAIGGYRPTIADCSLVMGFRVSGDRPRASSPPRMILAFAHKRARFQAVAA
jgi:hypothetical protein